MFWNDSMLMRRAVSISPPAFVAATKADKTAGTAPIPINKPTGTIDGDWLYAFVWVGNGTATHATISGFTEISYQNFGGDAFTILRKQASSEAATYSVNLAVNARVGVCLATYRGGLGTVDVVGTATQATTTSPTAPSITPSAAGTLIGFFANDNDGTTISSNSSGLTARTITGTMVRVDCALLDLTPSAAGATGTKSITFSGGSDDTTSVLMQIN